MPFGAKKWIVIGGVGLVVILAVVYSVYVLCYEDVHDGICILNLDISEESFENADKLIRENFSLDDKLIVFEYDDKEFEIPAKNLGITVDYEKTLSNAYNYGREGNFFKRIFTIISLNFNKKVFALEVKTDVGLIQHEMDKNLKDFIRDNVKNVIEMRNDCIVIRNGKEGMAVDVDSVNREIINNVSLYEFNASNNVEIMTIKPADITTKMLKGMFESDKKDFIYQLKEGKYYYEPSSLGISIDDEISDRILSENKTNTQEYMIPVNIDTPQKDIKYFSDNYIIDELGDYSTAFNPSNVERSDNIRLAAKKINGCLLEPGEVFSFNKVVGRRDEQSGFKTAKVYQSGEIVDGVGGGICQVSSTLFNAVLLADMEVVERTNHSMPVNYVENGRDATVSYDSIDFVFKNTASYPIRLDVNVGNGILTCKICGINEDNKTVRITTETVETIPYKTEYKDTSALYKGQTRVIKNGQNGCRVYTYKTVNVNNSIMPVKKICESYYIAIDEIVERGTKVVKRPVTEGTSKKEEKPVIPGTVRRRTLY